MTVSDYLNLPYTRVLKRDDEGDVMATIAELEGCRAYGTDEADALKNLREAMESWLYLAIESGQQIPLPESEEELPSGKILVRLPRHQHKRLIDLARADKMSLNSQMIAAVSEYIGRREHRTNDRVLIDHLRQVNQIAASVQAAETRMTDVDIPSAHTTTSVKAVIVRG